MRFRLSCFAMALLILMAVWLWSGDAHPDVIAEMECLCDEARAHIAERDALAAEPVNVPGRVATFDGGRTTIPPKVSDETIARIRGA